MVESGLSDQVEIVRVSPEAAEYPALKRRLSEALGRPATFPTVEIEPGSFKAETDELISYYAEANDVAADALPALAFYSETIFPQVIEFHRLLQQR